MGDYFVWDVSPVIIDGLPLRWYGLLFAIGFIVGYYILQWIFKREGRDLKDLETLTIFMIIATVVGARLGHCFFYAPAEYLANPIEILKIWEGGLASHGAGFGIIAAVWFFSFRKKTYSFLWVSDRLAIVIPFVAFCVRLGNFFNSEILGKATDVSWAVVFSRIDTIPRHPTQLYEGIAYLLIFVVLFVLYLKMYNPQRQGLLAGVLLLLLFSARFLIETFKEVQSAFETEMLLHLGQYLSFPFIILGIILIILAFRNSNNSKDS